MECIKCNQSDVFNRVVVNQISNDEVGLFCKKCEQETFGKLLDDSYWHNENGCSFCEDDGKFKLPPLDCLIEEENGSLIDIEYDGIFSSVQLCESHLKHLSNSDKLNNEVVSSEDGLNPSIEV